MANKSRKEFEYSEKDEVYVRRLVYDVLVYTLPKCGLPETELPPTDYEENVYNRVNFVEIAGLSALRIALILRDKWIQMFISRHSNSPFNGQNILDFLKKVILCFFLSWEDTRQSVLETYLALCNEIILFFHKEGIGIDFHVILNSISVCILGVIWGNENVLKTIEELVGNFDNISVYAKWINDFIANYAIPYGSKDVSNPFFEYVRNKWREDRQMTGFPETLSTAQLRDHLGFLPDDLFAIIAVEESTDLLENSPSASESILPSDHESFEPQKLSPSPESGAARSKESHGRQSTQSANASVGTAQGEDSSKKSSDLRIEDDLGQASQEGHGAIPKRKKSKKTKKSKKNSRKAASKTKDEFEDSKKDVEYVLRLVYDVLVYTLPKCGFPETELPPTNYEENDYNRANFVEIAGLSALRISLILRDNWRQMFISRHSNSPFNEENILDFLKKVILCFFLSWEDTRQSAVETFFALCNEIILFFHKEGIDIDFHVILNSISLCILGVISGNENVPETIEELVGKFDNISVYAKWINDFIANYAIPYGSRDVSNHFFEYVRNKWREDRQMIDFPEPLSTTELRNYLGFLPDDLFAIIEFEESTDLPENSPSASESILPSDHESFERQKLSPSPECGAAGGEESHGRQSTQSANASVGTAQGENRNKSSSELRIEDDLRQMSLGSEGASQEGHGAISKRKKSKKSKKKLGKAASNTKDKLHYSKKDVEYVLRLVYDVLVYTLPKCGFPETELPPTDYEENVYNRSNFVEIAGLSALRIALILRDKWRQMFISRHSNSPFNQQNILNFLKQVVLCYFLSWEDPTQSAVETFLALCNEIILFFHKEGIGIDFQVILNSISVCILGVISGNENVSNTIEELFGKFDNISVYTKWINDFIANYAIPYGSRDVSNHFFEYVRNKWREDRQMIDFPETLSTTQLRDYLGFLPDDLCAVIAVEEPTDLPENSPSASESILPSDRESFEPQKSPSPECGAAGGEETHGRQSTQSENALVGTAQGEDRSNVSSELTIEDALGQMCLGSEEATHESHVANPKRKKVQKVQKEKKVR